MVKMLFYINALIAGKLELWKKGICINWKSTFSKVNLFS